MIPIDEIQDHAKSVLDAAGFFPAGAVISDKGLADNAREAALETQKVAVTILAPLEGDAVSQGGGKAVLDCVLPVLVEVIATANTGGDTVNVWAAVREVSRALQLWVPPGIPTDRYTLHPQFMTLADPDIGLIRYVLNFRKKVVL